MMKNTLIIVPTEREAAYFADHGLHAHICGVGMAECAAATAGLLAEAVAAGRKPGLAIIAGIAGSCTDALATGDTVAVVSETIADLGRRNLDGSFTPLFRKTYVAGFVPEGLPTAQSHTVSMAGFTKTDRNGVWVENMEGAAFFAVCERFGVAAAEIRTISNRVGEPVTPAALDLAARRLAEILKTLPR